MSAIAAARRVGDDVVRNAESTGEYESTVNITGNGVVGHGERLVTGYAAAIQVIRNRIVGQRQIPPIGHCAAPSQICGVAGKGAVAHAPVVPNGDSTAPGRLVVGEGAVGHIHLAAAINTGAAHTTRCKNVVLVKGAIGYEQSAGIKNSSPPAA